MAAAAPATTLLPAQFAEKARDWQNRKLAGATTRTRTTNSGPSLIGMRSAPARNWLKIISIQKTRSARFRCAKALHPNKNLHGFAKPYERQDFATPIAAPYTNEETSPVQHDPTP